MTGYAIRTMKGRAAAFVLACLTTAHALAQTRPTESGAIQGLTIGDVAQFRGVPYAAPPVGDLRWRPPKLPIAHAGMLDATAYGPACEQQFAA